MSSATEFTDVAVNVRVRAELIDAINQRIAANGWTQAEAAQRLYRDAVALERARKLGVTTRGQAAAVAHRRGLVAP